MLHAGPIAPYVGFTETEVQKLCEVYGQKFEEVKRWYDGYQIGKYHVYNPNAVVNLMLEGEFQSYWSGTASYEAIVPLINMDFDGLKSAVIEMLSGDHVPVDVTSFQNDTVSFANKDDVLTYLIHLGYLAYDRTFRTAFIPNEEIRQELILATKRKKWNELIVFQKESEQLLKDTIQMNGNAVAKEIEKIHREYTSVIQYNNRKLTQQCSVHCLFEFHAILFQTNPRISRGSWICRLCVYSKAGVSELLPGACCGTEMGQKRQSSIRSDQRQKISGVCCMLCRGAFAGGN